VSDLPGLFLLSRMHARWTDKLQRGMRRAQKQETAGEATAAETHALLNLVSLANRMAEKGRASKSQLHDRKIVKLAVVMSPLFME
jgi:hypothetical protein